MPKIHGLVYVAVGLFISILASILNYKKFIFFVYSGLAFIFVGIVKLISDFMKRENIKETTHHKIHHQTQHIKYCHRCGSAARLHDNFCSKCGARV